MEERRKPSGERMEESWDDGTGSYTSEELAGLDAEIRYNYAMHMMSKFREANCYNCPLCAEGNPACAEAQRAPFDSIYRQFVVPEMTCPLRPN